jgi:transposase
MRIRAWGRFRSELIFRVSSLREDVSLPRKFPQEFREDVVAVARSREPGVTLSQIAQDFGISDQTLTNWLKQADIDDGRKPGQSDDDRAEVRELRRRNRLLEQENEVLRRAGAYLSQANLKLGGNPK